MAAVSPRRSPTSQTSTSFVVFFFLLLSGGGFVAVSSFKVTEGGVASLSCQYSVKRFGLSRVCWGRGCGTFWCSNIVVQTDENGVISKVEDRYRLTGDVLDGQMDLDILNVRRTDSGPYCCRVDIDGIFNDKKVIMNLRVIKALVTSPPTSPPPPPPPATTTEITRVTEPSASTVNWKTLLSSQLDLLRRNSTLLRADAVSGMHRTLKTSCFSSEELPHIIYEIRTRRPVQENIYTLD
ncbi:T-cell immunoglobulin and mucin domain-containing protein 4 [Aulostomus maculatus]